MFISRVKQGIIVEVTVHPNSPKFSIKFNNRIKVYCKSPPEKNKANLEIIKEFKRTFNREVEIISGLKSKKKRLIIHNITEKEFMEKLVE